MDKSVPNSPVPQNQSSGTYDDRALQPTPPNVFPFPNVSIPSNAQQIPHQPSYPLQAHVLVDPVTGQHYIVPQAYYPPIQPMYYPPPHPHQANQPNPMFYQYPKQMSSASPPMYMGMPMYNMPSSSSPSSSRTELVKNKVSGKDKNEEREKNDDEMSTTSSSRTSFSLLNQKNAQVGNQKEVNHDYAYRSPTSNPLLEFNQKLHSPVTKIGYEFSSNKIPHLNMDQSRGGTQSDFEERVNNFRDDLTSSSISDVETTRKSFRSNLPSKNTEKIDESAEKNEIKPFNPPSKSIRMEINFDDVPCVPSEPRPPRRSNATAFTVNLNEKEQDLSLQEAARNLAENRRKLKVGKNDPIVNNKTNKNYLLEKLLTGKNSTSTSNSNEYSNEDSSEIELNQGEHEEAKEFDARSEALTFVIDTSKRSNPGYYSQNQFQTRVVTYSDDDSSSDSEVMEQFTEKNPIVVEAQRPTALVQSRIPPPSVSLSSSSAIQTKPKTSAQKTPTTFNRSTGSNSGDFLQELAKLRLMAGLPASGIGGDVKESKQSNSFKRSEMSSARAPTVSSTQKAAGARASFNSRTRETAREASTTPISSRRSETRRSLGGNSSPQLGTTNRPPFKTGAPRGIMIGQSEQQREQERTAWLRRKDYNPMKAAAAGRKTSEQKTREQQFTSRRSMTFHSTNDPFTRAIPGNNATRPARNRSQEPRDLKNDKYRLSQRKNDKDDIKMSGLAKAVDLLSKKCKKSIELIRQQNKGCLSVSVEDLLSAAAEPPRLNESLDDQLERLSDAFDAVQRYLEQYSLDGYSSPVPDNFYEDDAVDSRSTFSGVSTHQNNDSVINESISSSYRKKVLDS